MTALLLSWALAQDPTEQLQQTKANLEETAELLRGLAPDLYAEAEREVNCQAALADPEGKIVELGDCLMLAAESSTSSPFPHRERLQALREQFPDEMAKQTDEFWLQKLVAAEMLHQTGPDEEATAAEEAP